MSGTYATTETNSSSIDLKEKQDSNANPIANYWVKEKFIFNQDALSKNKLEVLKVEKRLKIKSRLSSQQTNFLANKDNIMIWVDHDEVNEPEKYCFLSRKLVSTSLRLLFHYNIGSK